MAEQVLARKWRPKTFEDLIGQDHICRTLTNGIEMGRIAHAYLFTGIRGVGKTSAARILAKALNAEGGPSAKPDPESDISKEIDRGAYIDVIEIDGASNTGVDDVRELKENIQYLPSKGRFKVYIIDEVHMLSKAAFNALLKTLEEPPKGVVFIFATTEVQRVPETILSRCQRFDFKRVGKELLADRLEAIAKAENIKIARETLLAIASESQGSVRDSITLFDRIIAYCGKEVSFEAAREVLGLIDQASIHRLFEFIISGDAKEACLSLHKIYFDGFELKRVLGYMLETVRAASLLKVGVAAQAVGLSNDQASEISSLFKSVGEPALDRFFDLIKRSLIDISRSEHEMFLVEQLVLKLARTPVDFASIAEVLTHLKSMSGDQPSQEAAPSNDKTPVGGDTIDDSFVKKTVGLFDAKVERVQVKPD